MELTHLLVILIGAALPLLLLFSPADAGDVGVNYGRVANNLPDTASVVRLLKRNDITTVRLFDADQQVLTVLANTGIKVVVMLPNENLAAAAASRSYALQWVTRNVARYYPATQIQGVDVGNEVFEQASNLTQQLLPAMTNVQAALAQLGLADAVKVSTPIAFTALTDTFPPSSARFRDDIARPVMKPLLDFLQRTGSYLAVNPYPFFAYDEQPDKIPLDYALGNPNPGMRDDNTGLMYFSLLDAMLDATYFAMEKLEDSLSARQAKKGTVYVPESGWASGGKRRHGGKLGQEAGNGRQAASVANAQAYNNNLINRVLSGKTGTPYRPDADMDMHIFALFNENQKGDGPEDVEANFGLFYPNETKVYEFEFRQTWCVANASVGDARLQEALDYACGHGADCGAIQPGGACFEPNTRVAHASYAFNSYYHLKGRAKGACDFSGAAYVVYNEAAGTCDPNVSWCVANAAVGDNRLQSALDWACGHGADCSAIEPGGACFEPNTRVAHASYAFNSYYQRKHRARGTCDFFGAASVVYQAPKFGNCVLPSKAWIQETLAEHSEGYAVM